MGSLWMYWWGVIIGEQTLMWSGPVMKEIPGVCQRTYGDLPETHFPYPHLFLGTFTHFQCHLYFIKLNFLWEDSNLTGKERRDRLRNTTLLQKLWGPCRTSPHPRGWRWGESRAGAPWRFGCSRKVVGKTPSQVAFSKRMYWELSIMFVI